jgi:hypothetical protein
MAAAYKTRSLAYARCQGKMTARHADLKRLCNEQTARLAAAVPEGPVVVIDTPKLDSYAVLARHGLGKHVVAVNFDKRSDFARKCRRKGVTFFNGELGQLPAECPDLEPTVVYADGMSSTIENALATLEPTFAAAAVESAVMFTGYQWPQHARIERFVQEIVRCAARHAFVPVLGWRAMRRAILTDQRAYTLLFLRGSKPASLIAGLDGFALPAYKHQRAPAPCSEASLRRLLTGLRRKYERGPWERFRLGLAASKPGVHRRLLRDLREVRPGLWKDYRRWRGINRSVACRTPESRRAQDALHWRGLRGALAAIACREVLLEFGGRRHDEALIVKPACVLGSGEALTAGVKAAITRGQRAPELGLSLRAAQSAGLAPPCDALVLVSDDGQDLLARLAGVAEQPYVVWASKARTGRAAVSLYAEMTEGLAARGYEPVVMARATPDASDWFSEIYRFEPARK